MATVWTVYYDMEDGCVEYQEPQWTPKTMADGIQFTDASGNQDFIPWAAIRRVSKRVKG